MRLIGDRRILLGSVCVETVAAVVVLLCGHLSLVAIGVLYWIDLLFLTLRTTVQQLIARPMTDRRSTLFQRPFRLLSHKRGSITVTGRLPGLYLRNVPGVWGAAVLILLSATTTAYVAVAYVPGELWSSPGAPFLIGGGLVAAAAKSWLVLRSYLASGGHEINPASAVTPRKRILVFAVYGGLLWLASEWTLATLSQEGLETARAGMMISAAGLIVSRLAYGWYASRAQSDDGGASQGSSEPRAKEKSSVRSLPSVPDEEPRTTMAPVRASILAAGVVNAMTTGGVVDNQFGHWRQFTVRLGLAGVMVVAVLALLDGAVAVSATLAAIIFGLVGALSAVSAVHMLLALGGVEYRFYESEVVAYDRYIGRPQWSASYDGVRNVSVERGLFGSPLWLDTGTVSFDRLPHLKGDDSARKHSRSSIAFVPDPDRAGELIRCPEEP